MFGSRARTRQTGTRAGKLIHLYNSCLSVACYQILSLRHNRLSGRVPPELGRLSQLKTLYMEKNELEGTIPDTLANLASLEELNLIGNRFQGV